MNGNKMRRVAWGFSFLLLLALTLMLCVLPAGAEKSCNHNGEYENGFCPFPGCDEWDTAPLNADGVYEVSNAGQLYWVAQLIQSKPQDTAISVKLMRNITVNADLLDEHGQPRDTGRREWVPLGGGVTLDGQGHYISGLYAYDDDGDVGLFGNVQDVTVKNLGIEDSYFRSNNANAGGLIGKASANCEISHCYVLDTVTQSGNPGAYCGALVGVLEVDSASTVTNCYTTASLAFGFVGANNSVANCFYRADSETDAFDGTAYFTAEQKLADGTTTLCDALSVLTPGAEKTWVKSCHSGMPALQNYHVYRHVCTVVCQECHQATERADVVPHVYSDDCVDEYCDVCGGHTRLDPPGHLHVPACSTVCAKCRATIVPLTAQHNFTNPCDTVCDCGATRTVAGHAYSAPCEKSCTYCGEIRAEVAAHVYDDDCDALCNNGCGARRTPPHVYDNVCDATCNGCGKQREITHKYGEYVVTKEATAMRNGEQERVCELCGHKDVVAIARYGVATWIIVLSGVGVGLVLTLGGFALYWFVIKKRTFAELIGKSPAQLKAKDDKKRAEQRRLEREAKKQLAKANEEAVEETVDQHLIWFGDCTFAVPQFRYCMPGGCNQGIFFAVSALPFCPVPPIGFFYCFNAPSISNNNLSLRIKSFIIISLSL